MQLAPAGRLDIGAMSARGPDIVGEDGAVPCGVGEGCSAVRDPDIFGAGALAVRGPAVFDEDRSAVDGPDIFGEGGPAAYGPAIFGEGDPAPGIATVASFARAL